MTPPARWAAANKQLIGTAAGETSRVWFSCADGILTEVFYPTPDQACTRCLELVIASNGELCEEARDMAHEHSLPEPEVPSCSFVNACRGRYRIDKQVVADPLADVILVRARVTVLRGEDRARLYAILEPRLGNRGDDNTALLGSHKGAAMLFAQRADGLALALACSAPMLDATAGFAGSDGRAQLREHGRIVHRQRRAEHGEVSLTVELDHRGSAGELTLALGFGRTRDEAAHAATISLDRGFDAAHARYAAEWKAWHAELTPPPTAARRRLWTVSTTALKTLEAKHPTGGRVAALATPWGESRGPGIDGTYHLVWTRDLVESVTGLLAAGARGEVRHALEYLRASQEADGHWPQNMRVAGGAVWNNDELDEVALPLVFLSRAWRAGLVVDAELPSLWPMVSRAARWIAQHGPATVHDRWEDSSGVTPFSIAAAIVALLSAAELAELLGHRDVVAELRELADGWNASIENLLYRRGGPLADHVGVAGYYVRSHQPGQPLPALALASLPPSELSPDALALVRFGLRAADDPRVVDTVRAIDAVLRCDLPPGPAWRRYPGDRYGEHDDGAPFDGDGIGRAWPLLTGERAHYEIARGRIAEATALAAAIEGFANASGYLSEQVWDRPDLPARGLANGRPTHSAAPLGWAHAEYLCLCRSLATGRVFDLPAVSYERYVAPRAR